MKKMFLVCIFSAASSGCMTLSGNYTIQAHDATGKRLAPGLELTAQGSGIYSSRNALCRAFPKAIVTIREIKTGVELKSESPYQCQ